MDALAPPSLTHPTEFVGTDEALRMIFQKSVRPSPDWLRRQARAGRISHRRIGRNLLFRRDELVSELDTLFLHKAIH